jgi:hypothetical protein
LFIGEIRFSTVSRHLPASSLWRPEDENKCPHGWAPPTSHQDRPNHHPAAVDIAELETHRLRRAQSRRIGRRQRGTPRESAMVCGGFGQSQAPLAPVFDDSPKPTSLRYCMNGIAMTFKPATA